MRPARDARARARCGSRASRWRRRCGHCRAEQPRSSPRGGRAPRSATAAASTTLRAACSPRPRQASASRRRHAAREVGPPPLAIADGAAARPAAAAGVVLGAAEYVVHARHAATTTDGPTPRGAPRGPPACASAADVAEWERAVRGPSRRPARAPRLRVAPRARTQARPAAYMPGSAGPAGFVCAAACGRGWAPPRSCAARLTAMARARAPRTHARRCSPPTAAKARGRRSPRGAISRRRSTAYGSRARA